MSAAFPCSYADYAKNSFLSSVPLPSFVSPQSLCPTARSWAVRKTVRWLQQGLLVTVRVVMRSAQMERHAKVSSSKQQPPSGLCIYSCTRWQTASNDRMRIQLDFWKMLFAMSHQQQTEAYVAYMLTCPVTPHDCWSYFSFQSCTGVYSGFVETESSAEHTVGSSGGLGVWSIFHKILFRHLDDTDE